MLNLNYIDKCPPQALEIEEAILGALMLEPESFYKIGHLINSDCFYKIANQFIFEAIQTLILGNKKADIQMQLRIKF